MSEADDEGHYAGPYVWGKGRPEPTTGPLFQWIDGVLGGAHEYGDRQIIRISDGAVICACDDNDDAEQLCRLLSAHPELNWNGY